MLASSLSVTSKSTFVHAFQAYHALTGVYSPLYPFSTRLNLSETTQERAKKTRKNGRRQRSLLRYMKTNAKSWYAKNARLWGSSRTESERLSLYFIFWSLLSFRFVSLLYPTNTVSDRITYPSNVADNSFHPHRRPLSYFLNLIRWY